MSRTFATLVTSIAEADRAAASAAGQQVQQLLSSRAWLIGAWIVGFEQHGADRAAYGDRLIDRLAEALKAAGRKGLSARNLANYRQVAITYPSVDLSRLPGVATALARLPEIPQTSAESASQGSAAALPWRDAAWLHRLFTELTFSHLLELSRMDDALERGFYELHALAESWSVRELVRQRNTMLYQRVGLSSHRDEIVAHARAGAVFVSRYLLALPTEERLRQWLHEARALTEQQIRQTSPPQEKP